MFGYFPENSETITFYCQKQGEINNNLLCFLNEKKILSGEKL